MAGLDLGTLSMAIEVDVQGAIKQLGGFKQEVKNTGEESKTLLEKMNNAGKSIGDFGEKATKMGKGLSMKVTAPIIAVGTGLIALAKKSGDTADRLLDLHDITGMSTDSIQEWQHVSTVAGVSSEAMTSAVEGLVRRMPQLEAEGGKATEAINKLGFTFDELKAMSPDEMIDNLVYSMADMEDPLERNAIGSQLFGGAWKDMAPILGNGTDALKGMRGEAHDLGLVMSGEALQDANDFRVTMDTLTSTMKGAANQIGAKLAPLISDVLVPAIQNHVIPAITGFVDKVGELVTWFTELSPGIQKTIGVVAGIAVAIGPALVIIGKLSALVSSAIGIFTSVTGAIGSAGGAIALLTNPVTLTIAAIAGLIAIFATLYNTNDEFRENVNETWESIKESIEVFVEVVKELVSSFLDMLALFWEEWGEVIMEYITLLWDLISGVFNTALTYITDIFNVFAKIFQGDWEGAWEAVKTLFVNLWDNITALMQTYIDGVKNIVDKVMVKIKASWDKAWDSIKTSLSTAWDNMKKAVSDKANDIWQSVKDMAKNMLDALKNLPADARAMGKEFVQGMIDGIANMASALTEKVKGMAKGALDTAKSVLGIKSPSREMMKVGEYTAEGFADGISDSVGLVDKAIEDITNFKDDEIELSANELEFNLLDNLGDIGANLLDGLGSSLLSNFDSVMNTFANKDFTIPLAIKDMIGSNATKAVNNSTTTNHTVAPEIHIHVGSVRNDADIQKISRGLGKEMTQFNRTLGVI